MITHNHHHHHHHHHTYHHHHHTYHLAYTVDGKRVYGGREGSGYPVGDGGGGVGWGRKKDEEKGKEDEEGGKEGGRGRGKGRRGEIDHER